MFDLTTNTYFLLLHLMHTEGGCLTGSPRVGTTGLHACQRLHPTGKPHALIYEVGLQLPRTAGQASLVGL